MKITADGSSEGQAGELAASHVGMAEPGHEPVSEPGHEPVILVSPYTILPSADNDQLYNPFNADDADDRALMQDVMLRGVQEPLAVWRAPSAIGFAAGFDYVAASGHRRLEAARLAGRDTVPVRILGDWPLDPDERLAVIRSYNRQREKSFDERVREELLDVDPESAHRQLSAFRKRQAGDGTLASITIVGTKSRDEISGAKTPMLDAVKKVVFELLKDYWPVSVRQVHYNLLPLAPRIHAKRAKRYDNTQASYKRLVDLLARARVAGLIPFEAISDETRPVEQWQSWATSSRFVRDQVEGFLQGYWRDLMQSQPDHVELIVEKQTVRPIVTPVAQEFCIPMTTGRGYASLPPRHSMAQRFRRGGKSRLVLLFVSDFDPDGEEIAHSLTQSMRDDFEIPDVVGHKVALTAQQVDLFQLPKALKAKKSSSNHAKFVGRHGDDVYELEALAPARLQSVVSDAIRRVIDLDLYNREVQAEREDAAKLAATRRSVVKLLRGIDLGNAP